MSLNHDSISTGSFTFIKRKEIEIAPSEDTKHSHRYNTRSSARRNRSSFSINNNTADGAFSSIHSLPGIGVSGATGCGDVEVSVGPESTSTFFSCHNDVGNVIDTKIRSVKKMDDGGQNTYVRVLKALLCVGLSGLLVFGMIDKYIYNNFTMESIRDELDTVKRDLQVLDNKISEVAIEVLPVLSKNQILILNELKNQFTEQSSLIQNKMPNVDMIKELVKDVLGQYDADKTGLTDFALASAGGSIVSTRNTETYTAGAPWWSLYGVPLCSYAKSPRTIIQPSSLPGECWAFRGSTGAVVIQLLGKVRITGVSLEHIPASISATGHLTTAPQVFSIWGLNRPNDVDGYFLGKFEYCIDGPSVQYFVIQNCDTPFTYVELKIHSNHGNLEYTCIYRLRVHGKLEGAI